MSTSTFSSTVTAPVSVVHPSLVLTLANPRHLIPTANYTQHPLFDILPALIAAPTPAYAPSGHPSIPYAAFTPETGYIAVEPDNPYLPYNEFTNRTWRQHRQRLRPDQLQRPWYDRPIPPPGVPSFQHLDVTIPDGGTTPLDHLNLLLQNADREVQVMDSLGVEARRDLRDYRKAQLSLRIANFGSRKRQRDVTLGGQPLFYVDSDSEEHSGIVTEPVLKRPRRRRQTSVMGLGGNQRLLDVVPSAPNNNMYIGLPPPPLLAGAPIAVTLQLNLTNGVQEAQATLRMRLQTIRTKLVDYFLSLPLPANLKALIRKKYNELYAFHVAQYEAELIRLCDLYIGGMSSSSSAGTDNVPIPVPLLKPHMFLPLAYAPFPWEGPGPVIFEMPPLPSVSMDQLLSVAGTAGKYAAIAALGHLLSPASTLGWAANPDMHYISLATLLRYFFGLEFDFFTT